MKGISSGWFQQTNSSSNGKITRKKDRQKIQCHSLPACNSPKGQVQKKPSNTDQDSLNYTNYAISLELLFLFYEILYKLTLHVPNSFTCSQKRKKQVHFSLLSGSKWSSLIISSGSYSHEWIIHNFTWGLVESKCP